MTSSSFTIKKIANYSYPMRPIKRFSLFFAAIAASSSLLAGTLSVTVVDREGKPTMDAVVVLSPANRSGARASLPMQATIMQEKMQFVPAVTVVGVGAKLNFVNNDPWDHHVRATPAGAAAALTPGSATAEAFELRLEGKGDGKSAKSTEVTMSKAGAQSATLLGCFLHGTMRGHVYVSDSPWAVKTNAEGVASFSDVPDGAVQVRVWQADQIVDLPPQSVTVGAAPAQLRVQLQVTPRRRRT
jgi:plastocyanin